MSVSLTLAKRITNVRYDDLSGHVVEMTKQSILDAVSVTLVANTLGEGCRAFVDLGMAEHVKNMGETTEVLQY